MNNIGVTITNGMNPNSHREIDAKAGAKILFPKPNLLRNGTVAASVKTLHILLGMDLLGMDLLGEITINGNHGRHPPALGKILID